MTLLSLNKYISYIVILLLVSGQFGRIPVGGYIVGVYIWDLFIAIYVVLFILKNIKNSLNPAQLSIPMFYRYLVLFILWALIGIINGYRYVGSITEYLVSLSYLLRFIAYTLFTFGVYQDLVRDSRYKKNLLKTVAISGFLISVLGFIQLLVFPDLGKLDPSLLWDPHKGRLVSTMLDPNFVAIILIIPLLSAVALLLKSIDQKEMKNIILMLSLIAIMLIAELLTYSRSGWLALTTVLLILSLLKYRLLLVATFILAFSSYYFIPRIQTRIAGITDPSDSFYFRYISWGNAIVLIRENPIIGYGYNTYRYVQFEHGFFGYQNEIGNRAGAGSDSSLLQIWATTGIVGLLLYISAYISVLVIAIHKYLTIDKNIYSVLIIAMLFALLAESQFINSLLYPHVLILSNIFIAYFLADP